MSDKKILNNVSIRDCVILASTPQGANNFIEKQLKDIFDHKIKMLSVMGESFDFEYHLKKAKEYASHNCFSISFVLAACEKQALSSLPFIYDKPQIQGVDFSDFI